MIIEKHLEELIPKLPRWPLTTFGTVIVIIFLLGVSFGVYQWISCLEIRGLM